MKRLIVLLLFLLSSTTLAQAMGTIFNPDGAANAQVLAPFFVSLTYDSTSPAGFCGAAAVSNEYETGTVLVTAAHCIASYTKDLAVAKAHGNSYKILQIDIHADYEVGQNRSTGIGWDFDVAKVYVDGFMLMGGSLIPTVDIDNGYIVEVLANQNIGASDKEVFENSTLVGTGLNEFGVQPDQLMYADLAVLTEGDCEARMPQRRNGLRGGVKVDITSRQTCTVTNPPEIGGVNTTVCNGDSGGPLFSRYVDKYLRVKFVLLGITSWRYPCGNYSPDVFTKMSNPDILSWLEEDLGITVAYR